MNIDEVLLTKEEIEKAHEGKEAADAYEWDIDIAKAAQLKLLELLKEYCTNAMHNLDGDFSYIRAECPECLAELESKLKEG